MAQVSTYLNFTNKTEEAFLFYKTVFGTEFVGESFTRFKDIPPMDGMPPMSEADNNLIMHVALPTIGGHVLMSSDAPESMGFKINQGNNVYINLQPDTRAETLKLFNALSAGGVIEQELQDMFWGDYFGSCEDKFGIHWMFACTEKAK